MSGRVIVLAFLVLVLGAGGLLLWATQAARGSAPAIPARMPRPIAADALPEAGGEGAKLVERYCGACHALPDPAQHPAAAWPGVLAEMERQIHARIMRNAPAPSREEWRALEAYLRRHAADGAGGVAAREATAGGEAAHE